MLQIYHVSTLYHGILIEKCSYYIVGALRRRYFPYGEITGRLIRPYMAYATELPLQKFRCEDMLY